MTTNRLYVLLLAICDLLICVLYVLMNYAEAVSVVLDVPAMYAGYYRCVRDGFV